MVWELFILLLSRQGLDDEWVTAIRLIGPSVTETVVLSGIIPNPVPFVQ